VRVLVNGVWLFFDVEGPGLVPDGPAMRGKPTFVLLHGGPGFDHSIYKPVLSSLADIAQVVFLDHRGNGPSDPGPQSSWTPCSWMRPSEPWP
jgi:pimeloyl-ACP methyl ester carboxylesterase